MMTELELMAAAEKLQAILNKVNDLRRQIIALGGTP